MGFLNEVVGIKKERRAVMISENIDFVGSIIQKFQRLKILTMVIVYMKNPEFLYESFYLWFSS